MGIGSRAGLRAAEDLHDVVLRSALVTGLCGLLSHAFTVGDALVYASVRDGEAPLVVFDRTLSDAVAGRVPGVQTGIRAVHASGVVTRAVDKRALHERFRADAVDMESLTLAASLQCRRVAVAALRVGSDRVDEDLPELDRALDGSGGIDGFALTLAMLRRPLAGARLALNGTRALAALEAAVYAAVR